MKQTDVHISYFASVLGLLVLTALACGSGTPLDNGVASVAAGDKEMSEAIATARRTLPEFWRTYSAPTRGERGFALKVAIRDGAATEHFWVVDVERRNDKILGTINNEPETVSTVTFGQRLEVPEADITDWMFLRNDKFVGNHTVRPLFKTMPPEDVARIKAMMESP
jgi:uncharacterized protein YegJ (DUF2314 family)